MPAFTTNQWAILFLVFLLGWILGLASRAGGAKWKRALAEEREERMAEQRRHAQEIAASNARIVELESRAPVAAPVVAAPVAAATPAPVETVAASRTRPDDLSLIRGVGPVGEKRLNEQGVHGYRDIVALDASGKAALEARLGAPAGTIDRDNWQEQAAALDRGGLDEHRRLFG